MTALIDFFRTYLRPFCNTFFEMRARSFFLYVFLFMWLFLFLQLKNSFLHKRPPSRPTVRYALLTLASFSPLFLNVSSHFTDSSYMFYFLGPPKPLLLVPPPLCGAYSTEASFLVFLASFGQVPRLNLTHSQPPSSGIQ